MTLTIRPPAAADRLSWYRLWNAYLEFHDNSLPDEISRITFDRLLDPDRPQQCGLLALEDGQAVGLAHYIFHPHCRHVEDVCYLQDLFTDPAYRGQGVGRALVKGVYEAADRVGAPSVYWITRDSNEIARALFDRVGELTPFIKYRRSEFRMPGSPYSSPFGRPPD
ncbi:MAG: GNAT family N-acetyltransferase [Gammaproteobacteria bacterium]|nr:GNAT family N-acetyltransferase [Gammaproteobacteria bacterium]